MSNKCKNRNNMANKVITFEGHKKGYNLCWYVCTQSWSKSVIRLYDNKGKEYFVVNKNLNDSSFHVWSQGNADFTGDKLFLSIDIPDSKEIKHSLMDTNINDSKGEQIGHVNALCIEDYIDEDYNDIYVNVTGWSKKG